MNYGWPNTPESSQYIELMIANMLNSLNNPSILKMMSDDELVAVVSVVKNHVVTKAQNVLKWQEDYENNNEKIR